MPQIGSQPALTVPVLPMILVAIGAFISGCSSPLFAPSRPLVGATSPVAAQSQAQAQTPPDFTELAISLASPSSQPASSVTNIAQSEPTPPIVELDRLLSSPPEGLSVYHEVHPGDTLQTLSVRYRVNLGRLIRMNGLSASTPLTPGQLLYIPRGKS